MRIVSLLPSATEIVCLLGAAGELVGVSHECDYPPEVQRLPRLTKARVPQGSSKDIDEAVRSVLIDALAVYEVDVEGLRAADPDVVVTQDLCDVCAVSLREVEEAVQAACRPTTRVVSLRPTRLGDILNDIDRVGAALGREAQAEQALKRLRDRIDAVRAKTAGLARPRVLTVEWLDPVMIGGTWMPELVEIAGGQPLVTQPGQHAPTLDEAALEDLEVDVVLFKPCGFPIARAREEQALMNALLGRYPGARGWVADGNAYFNRSGPRIVDSLEILAGCLHPGLEGLPTYRGAAEPV